MKKADLTEEYIIDWWRGKYHNTNLVKVLEAHPEWQDDPPSHSREFYAAYPCTQAQSDEWEKWMLDILAKTYRISKKYARRSSWPIILNCSPMVKDD